MMQCDAVQTYELQPRDQGVKQGERGKQEQGTQKLNSARMSSLTNLEHVRGGAHRRRHSSLLNYGCADPRRNGGEGEYQMEKLGRMWSHPRNTDSSTRSSTHQEESEIKKSALKSQTEQKR